MNDSSDDSYEEWLQAKRKERAPGPCAESVLNALSKDQEHATTNLWTLASWAKAALFILAATLGIGRYGLLLFCLIFS